MGRPRRLQSGVMTSSTRAHHRSGWSHAAGRLVAGAVGLVAAYLSRRHFAVWCAHAFLVCVYFGIEVTTMQSVVAFGGGWQHMVVPVGAFVWHAALSRIMRPFPVRARAAASAD